MPFEKINLSRKWYQVMFIRWCRLKVSVLGSALQEMTIAFKTYMLFFVLQRLNTMTLAILFHIVHSLFPQRYSNIFLHVHLLQLHCKVLVQPGWEVLWDTKAIVYIYAKANLVLSYSFDETWRYWSFHSCLLIIYTLCRTEKCIYSLIFDYCKIFDDCKSIIAKYVPYKHLGKVIKL